MNIRGKVISAFPCTGKTWLYENSVLDIRIVDSDSSNFSWKSKGVRHPEWPDNYINHIKTMLKQGYTVLVSSHKEVRSALLDHGIEFILVYPEHSLLHEYYDRAINRGSSKEFALMLMSNWSEWHSDMVNQKGCTHIELKSNEYIDNITRLR